MGTTGGGKSVLDASLAGHTDSGYYDTSKDNNNPNVTNVQVRLKIINYSMTLQCSEIDSESKLQTSSAKKY